MITKEAAILDSFAGLAKKVMNYRGEAITAKRIASGLKDPEALKLVGKDILTAAFSPQLQMYKGFKEIRAVPSKSKLTKTIVEDLQKSTEVKKLMSSSARKRTIDRLVKRETAKKLANYYTNALPGKNFNKLPISQIDENVGKAVRNYKLRKSALLAIDGGLMTATQLPAVPIGGTIIPIPPGSSNLLLAGRKKLTDLISKLVSK